MSIKNYTRGENIYLSKLNLRAERFEDMIDSMKNIIKEDPRLSTEEREIFSSGYKNLISPKRSSWRILSQMELKEIQKKDKLNKDNLSYIRLTKENISNEVKTICDEVQELIDTMLLPNCREEEFEAKVFYLKLKGDYYRYYSEVLCEDEFFAALDKTEKAYKIAYNISERELPIFSTIRLGLCLNYSVFLCEMCQKIEEGTFIARQGFEEAVKLIDDLDKDKVKDAIMIIQILKENLILWTSELQEEEYPN